MKPHGQRNKDESNEERLNAIQWQQQIFIPTPFAYIRGIGEMSICVENHHSPYTQHSIVNIQQSYGYVLTYVAFTIMVCVSLYVFELSALSVYINEIGSDKAKVSITAHKKI